MKRRGKKGGRDGCVSVLARILFFLDFPTNLRGGLGRGSAEGGGVSQEDVHTKVEVEL